MALSKHMQRKIRSMFKISRANGITKTVTINTPVNSTYDALSGTVNATTNSYNIEAIVVDDDRVQADTPNFIKRYKLTIMKKDVDNTGGISERSTITLGGKTLYIVMLSQDQTGSVYVISVKAGE